MRYNLSEVNSVIQDRRSISPKNFSERKVHKEIVEKLLENARWAPTHGMTQPWRFKVFMEEGRIELSRNLERIYKNTTPTEEFKEKKAEKLRDRPLQCSVTIAICMERDPKEQIPEIEEIEAVACAVQNMQLTATAYGLGSFWSSPAIVYTDEMKNFLELGEKDRCLGLFYLGYPDVDWPKGQRKPLEYFVEWRTVDENTSNP